MTSDAEVQTVRERFAKAEGRQKEMLRATRLHGADTTSKSRVGEWELLVTFRSRKVTLPYGTAVPKHFCSFNGKSTLKNASPCTRLDAQGL